MAVATVRWLYPANSITAQISLMSVGVPLSVKMKQYALI